MASGPAQRLSLHSKGTLRPGADADITVFDLERIRDLATYDEPALAPEGIEYVVIAGEGAVHKGDLVNETLGRAVRFGD